MEFEGKTAVITGAAGGIGRAVALAMAKLGTDIVVADIDRDGIERVCGKITGMGRRALAVRCDVSQDADVENLAYRSISEMGKVDILMNNTRREIVRVFFALLHLYGRAFIDIWMDDDDVIWVKMLTPPLPSEDDEEIHPSIETK